MLVLLVAAVTLCCLSLLVCIRMQCLRMQQRRELMRRAPPMPQLSPEELMRRLSPHLRQTVAKPDDPFVDETCAICLGDYEPGDSLRLLPCNHTFHLHCLTTWAQRKKHATRCPLCAHPVFQTKADAAEAQAADEAERSIELTELPIAGPSP